MGELLTGNTAVLNRWTQYCWDLYNHPIQPDISLIDGDSISRAPSALPVLREEMKEAIHSLPTKSPGADNISVELFKDGGKELVTIITSDDCSITL